MEENTINAAAQADKNAVCRSRRDDLILENMHLVRNIASSVQRSLSVHTEIDDLIHAGTMGLFEAATKYQDGKEVPFAVYAKHRIRGAILDGLRQIDWASRDARKHYKQMQQVTRDLACRLQRTPTQDEVAEGMGLDQKRWQALMIDFRTLGLCASRQAQASDSEDKVAREVPSPVTDGPDHVFGRTELRQNLSAAMSCLPDRHQQVVTLYYDRDMTMREIGTMLGVNESRVSQIHKSALARMQTFLSGQGISSSAALC